MSPSLCVGKALDWLLEYQRLLADDGGAHGAVLAAGSRSFWAGSHAEVVEAQAIFWAMQFCLEQGWLHVVFEGDCKCLIEALSGKCSRGFRIQTIIDNCRLLAINFSSISFSFCFRVCNGVAHRLAKWAMSSCCDKVWVHDVPPWLGDALYFDIGD
ncbi:unnamed protein product [Amaranthus hypochondriacus]